MARTSHLSTQQAHKVRGNKTKQHAQRDGSIKKRGDRGTSSRPALEASKVSFDWLIARGGDTRRIDETLEFIPGIGQLADIRRNRWTEVHNPYNWLDEQIWVEEPAMFDMDTPINNC